MRKHITIFGILFVGIGSLALGFARVGTENVPDVRASETGETAAFEAGSFPVAEDRVRPNRAQPLVEFPIEQYRQRVTLKHFGTWVDDGRFVGYHLGEDIEFGDTVSEVPVHAIAGGIVRHAGWVNGYGGMMLIEHEINGERISAIYGHLDEASFPVKAGDKVRKGDVIGMLGEGHTHETDNRRKHLHFALYNGEDLRFDGYTMEKEDLMTWIDPAVFFESIE